MSASRGFTLLEIMMVLFIIGMVVSTITYNSVQSDPEKQLQNEAKRLQVIFDMASDFAVLNQTSLGLRIDQDKASYEFVKQVSVDEWQSFDDQKMFALRELPAGYSLEIALDNLAWQDEDSLFDDALFDEDLSVSDDSVNIGDEDDLPPPPPQVLLLSSGEFTPFELRMRYQSDTTIEVLEYRILGKDYTPLELVSGDGVE